MRMNNQSNRYKKKNKKKDSDFLTVTLVQSILCVAMLAIAFFMSNYLNMTELKPAFSALITSQTQAVEVFKALEESLPSADTSLFKLGAGGAKNVTIPSNVFPGEVIMSQSAIFPVNGRITSSFGSRTHPVTGNKDFHTGLDIAAPLGTPIKAAYHGVVSEVGVSEIYGNFITLTHGLISTRYSHCDSIVAEVGMTLRQGETIATVGQTGLVTGPHLHLELLIKNKLFNPLYAL